MTLNDTPDRRSLDEIMAEALDALENPRPFTFDRDTIRTGLAEFDELHHGFRRGHLVTVAARDSKMATDFALTIVRQAVLDGAATYVSNGDHADGPDWAQGAFVREVEHRAHRGGLRLAAIDPITAFAPSSTEMGMRVEALDFASRNLFQLVHETKTTIIAVAPLKDDRGVDRLPLLCDLGDADGFTCESDTVIILHGAGDNRPGEVDVVVAKHRHGPTGKVAVHYQPETGRFADIPTSGDA